MNMCTKYNCAAHKTDVLYNFMRINNIPFNSFLSFVFTTQVVVFSSCIMLFIVCGNVTNCPHSWTLR